MSTGMGDTSTPSEQKAANTSLGDLLGEVTRDVSTLMRQEIALAKAELAETGKRAGKSAGLLGGAGYAGMMAVLFVSIAAWWGLGYLIGNAWSAVVVATSGPSSHLCSICAAGRKWEPFAVHPAPSTPSRGSPTR
jgi:hypothetical protein